VYFTTAAFFVGVRFYFFTEDNAMLVLTRKPGEKIRIGSDITLVVVKVNGEKIRIGIDAPKEVVVLRAELKESSLEI
jgi:carbon storage regulator CsrA